MRVDWDERYVRWACWTLFRIAVTLAGCWTVRRAAAMDGHDVDMNLVLVVAAAVLVVTRLWAPGKD